ncbi:MAG: cytochrome c [Flavobacteriales bacterium]|jgi:mono/diheme cytochrome c family protein
MNIKNQVILAFLSIGVLGFISSSYIFEPKELQGNEKILDIVQNLGMDMPLHFIPKNKLDSAKIAQGKNLVTQGFLNPENKKTFETRQSRYFVCTDCHNIQREDPDLSKSDPEARLAYVAKNKLKFLPATTLYGTVNKKHWYNDDYSKKYGSLVIPARDTLKNAVQLCAVVCSQGRELTQQEMEAVMHFLNSIGYETNELNLTDSEKTHIAKAISEPTNSNKEDAVRILKSKFLDYSPATFMNPQSLEERGLGKTGNASRGKQIYELSCMTCHKEGGVTNYKLSDDKLTHKHLKFWSGTHKTFSIYDITRKGTYSKNGYKPYMPNYTKERLSDQQLEDLMAYINEMATK